MDRLAEPGRARRFACTQCGACCNRSPEVELSEAADLADVFVLRLMFRVYELPRRYLGGPPSEQNRGSADLFYERRRLLDTFCARKSPVKRTEGGKAAEYVRYLTVSALSLDDESGACAALAGGRCSIYERRPLACRTVPFHYSRGEAAAGADLDAFVATPGFGCDTSEAAPVAVDEGRIVDPGWRAARGEAFDRAGRDRPWREAIVRRLKARPGHPSLPTLQQIEADSAFGATTAPMAPAWEIAAETGLMTSGAAGALVAAQAALIDRALAHAGTSPTNRTTLADMRRDYRARLAGSAVLA